MRFKTKKWYKSEFDSDEDSEHEEKRMSNYIWKFVFWMFLIFTTFAYSPGTFLKNSSFAGENFEGIAAPHSDYCEDEAGLVDDTEIFGSQLFKMSFCRGYQKIIANRWAFNKTSIKAQLSRMSKSTYYIYVLTLPNTGVTQLLYDISETTGYLPESWYRAKDFGKSVRGPDGRHFHYFEDDPKAMGYKNNNHTGEPTYCKSHGLHTIFKEFPESALGFITTYRDPISFWDARRRYKHYEAPRRKPTLSTYFPTHGQRYIDHFSQLIRAAEDNEKFLVMLPFETYVKHRVDVLNALFHEIPAFQIIYSRRIEAKKGKRHAGDANELKEFRRPGKFGDFHYDVDGSDETDLTSDQLDEFMQGSHRLLQVMGYKLNRGDYVFHKKGI